MNLTHNSIFVYTVIIRRDTVIIILRLRTKIAILISAVVLINFLGTGYIFSAYSEKIKEKAIQKIQNQIADKIVTKLDSLLSVPVNINRNNMSLFKLEGGKAETLETLQKFFADELKNNPEADIIAIGLEDGRYVEAQRLDDGTIRLGNRSEESGGALNIWETDKDYRKTRLVRHIENYDHRKRPWYVSAVDSGKMTWSDVYFYSSTHYPAISCNFPFSGKDGTVSGVFVTTISLNGISRFLKHIHISPNSRIIITDNKGLLLGASFTQPLTDNKGKRIAGTGTVCTEVNTAEEKYSKTGKHVFTLKEEGSTTMIRNLTYSASPGSGWNIMIMTPEADFTGEFDEYTVESIIFLILILALSFVSVNIIIGKITKPIALLADRISSVAYKTSDRNETVIPESLKTTSKEIMALSENFEIMLENIDSAFRTLEASRLEYKNLIENINSIIMTVNPDGTITYCNPYGLKYYGYEKDELIGNTVQKTVLRGLGAEPHNILEKIFREDNKYWNGENINVTRAGKKVWILWSNRLIFNEDGTVKELLSIGQDITRIKNTEKELGDSLKKNSILLKEIHHRVKNNLQIIISLINLQMDKTSTPAVTSSLKEIKGRIQSMAIVHEMLYSSSSFSEIDLGQYTESLLHDIVQTFHSTDKEINFSVESERILLELDKTITVGLILNELISNSVKYAFTGPGPGEISITVTRLEDNRISVTVRDNGTGFADNNHHKEGLGTILIEALTEQIGAEVNKKETNGFYFNFTFKPS